MSDPVAHVMLYKPKTKITKAKWAAYTPIWLPAVKKWKNWRVFASYITAKRYADSISPEKDD